jgi:hypothetical protein
MTTSVPAEPATPEAAPANPTSDAKPNGSDVFDPAELSPAARKWLEGQLAKGRADADAKARTASKDNARAEVTKAIADALGITPKEVDPAEVARQLTQAQSEARTLKIDRAIDRAARAAGADEDLVGAVLARKGALAKLDPSADDFDKRVADLVRAEVDGNPRLKLVADPEPPKPAAKGATGNFSGGSGEKGKRPGLTEAIAGAIRR